MESIPKEIKLKIKEKILGIAYVRTLENLDSKITIPEFKFIIGVYKIKKQEWFRLAKEFEREGLIKIHYQRPIEIFYKKPFIKRIKNSLTI